MLNAKFLLIDSGWLVLLAFGYLVITRELALVDHRTRLYGASVPDGLEVGTPMPGIARISQGDIFVFLFADCGGCQELLGHLKDVPDPSRLAVVIRDEKEQAMVQTMAQRVPKGIKTYSGESAQKLIEGFNVHSAPIAFRVRRGLIVAKGYLRDAGDIRNLSQGMLTMSRGAGNVASRG
jgi:hypothetical protein